MSKVLKEVKTKSTKLKSKMQTQRRIKREEKVHDEDMNYWGDAPKYASEFYGDVAWNTTRFDNQWD